MRPRLGAKARRAGRRLENEEDTEALWYHRSDPHRAAGPAMSVGGVSGDYRGWHI
jgi:hypothetical protein